MERSVARVERLRKGVNVLNRPLGSNANLSKEDQLADWQQKLADPNALAQAFQQRAQTVGPQIASYELVKWDSEMAKLAGEVNDNTLAG